MSQNNFPNEEIEHFANKSNTTYICTQLTLKTNAFIQNTLQFNWVMKESKIENQFQLNGFLTITPTHIDCKQDYK